MNFWIAFSLFKLYFVPYTGLFSLWLTASYITHNAILQPSDSSASKTSDILPFHLSLRIL